MADVIGTGLLRPFRRDEKNDFANGSEIDLVKSIVAQALGTRGASTISQGELPWRTNAGSLLYLIRHRNNTATTRELARVYVQDALRLWAPMAIVRAVEIEEADESQKPAQFILRIKVRKIDRNNPRNKVSSDEPVIEVPV